MSRQTYLLTFNSDVDGSCNQDTKFLQFTSEKPLLVEESSFEYEVYVDPVVAAEENVFLSMYCQILRDGQTLPGGGSPGDLQEMSWDHGTNSFDNPDDMFMIDTTLIPWWIDVEIITYTPQQHKLSRGMYSQRNMVEMKVGDNLILGGNSTFQSGDFILGTPPVRVVGVWSITVVY